MWKYTELYFFSWEIIACKYCGSDGAHSKCIDTNYFICQRCFEFIKPATSNAGSVCEKSDEDVDGAFSLFVSISNAITSYTNFLYIFVVETISEHDE